MDLRKVIADVPDFPKPGILFRDITPVVEDPAAFAAALEGLHGLIDGVDYSALAAIESRGFVFGGPLALKLNKRLVLVRKIGKLPRKTVQTSYALEYGEATIEVHSDSFHAGESVVVLDDLLATGGTAAATGELIRTCGAQVAAYLFLVELEALGGRAKLPDAPVFSLVKYP
jgi:adenine phosphoribosyltransferase